MGCGMSGKVKQMAPPEAWAWLKAKEVLKFGFSCLVVLLLYLGWLLLYWVGLAKVAEDQLKRELFNIISSSQCWISEKNTVDFLFNGASSAVDGDSGPE